MISVLALSAAAQIEVEFQLGSVEPIYIVDEPQSVFPTGLNELMGMVEQMQRSQPRQMMQSPCTNDQVRFHCGPDAACLKAHLAQLSPSCTMFLLKSTEEARPSPSPAPLEAAGFYSQAFLGQDGQMYIEEGQLSPREGKVLQGEMQGMMDLVMSEFFGQRPPQPLSAPSPRPSAGAHPCEAEVFKCKEELNGDTSRAPMQECLIAHYAQLSSGCKCFLHQVMGEELEQAVGNPAAKSVDPRVPAVAITEGRVTGSLVFLREAGESDEYARTAGPPPPGHHRFTCALFMMLFFLSFFLVLRRAFSLCCLTPKPRFAAVVPPQQRVQLSIEPLVAQYKITTTKM